jgi:hypothetical protein
LFTSTGICLPDRFGRLHQPALGRHVRNRDQPGALVDRAFQRRDVDLAVIIVRHHHQFRAGLLGDLQIGDVVRRIFTDAGQDAVARLEVERIESEVPGARGVLDEGDFARLGPDQPGGRGIEAVELVAHLVGRLVAADRGFELQMIERGIERALARQRRAGGVEMQHMGAARCFGAQTVKI